MSDALLSRIIKAGILPAWALEHQFLTTSNKLGLDSVFIEERELQRVPVADAKLISSESILPGMHRPLLDLDFRAALLPSSTKGHYHLYLERAVSTENYRKLLRVLVEVGLIQEGFAKEALDGKRGTTLRLPWVKKGEDKTLNEVSVDKFLEAL